MNQRECGARCGRRRAQTGGETFHELGFAAAEIAGEREYLARFHIAGEATTE